MNNHYLGMVRQWQELFYEDRKSGVDLEGNPDFVKLAERFPGAKGFNLKRGGRRAQGAAAGAGVQRRARA